jgi:hypothetical protein
MGRFRLRFGTRCNRRGHVLGYGVALEYMVQGSRILGDVRGVWGCCWVSCTAGEMVWLGLR